MATEQKKPSEMTLQEFNDYLNEEPNPDHVKTNDDGYKHIPIAFLEQDLREAFEGQVEYQKTPNQQLFNAVDCDVIIQVFHPVLKVYQRFYGTGTVLIERVEKHAKYVDATKVVKEEDESLATSRAFAEGKKSAAKGMGRRFGSNLNRENVPGKEKSVYKDLPELRLADLKTDKDFIKAITQGQLTIDAANKIRAEREGCKVTDLKPLKIK